jgi:hypothetical protein
LFILHIEIVDFMINSVEFLLIKEFNKSLNDKKLNILILLLELEPLLQDFTIKIIKEKY